LRDLVVVLDEQAVAGVATVLDGLPAAPANAWSDGDAVSIEALVPGAA